MYHAFEYSDVLNVWKFISVYKNKFEENDFLLRFLCSKIFLSFSQNFKNIHNENEKNEQEDVSLDVTLQLSNQWHKSLTPIAT